MKELKGSQRKYLRSLAHNLNPICYVGKNGVTDAVIESVKVALDTNELIKVKFIDCKPEKKELSAKIAQSTDSNVAGLIGNVATIYREHPDKEKRKITIPKE